MSTSRRPPCQPPCWPPCQPPCPLKLKILDTVSTPIICSMKASIFYKNHVNGELKEIKSSFALKAMKPPLCSMAREYSQSHGNSGITF